MTALRTGQYEAGIDAAAHEARRIAHDTVWGKVARAIARVTLDPVFDFLVDHPFRIKEGEGADHSDR